eukprot:scaffold326773_cov52-Tisochrysis_lutea.AAC.1
MPGGATRSLRSLPIRRSIELEASWFAASSCPLGARSWARLCRAKSAATAAAEVAQAHASRRPEELNVAITHVGVVQINQRTACLID